MPDTTTADPFTAWDKSLERLVLIDASLYEQLRAAFEAGRRSVTEAE